jgi:hypothetical protein
MKSPIAISALLVLSAAGLSAADNALASDLAKLNSAYRNNLEDLRDRAVAAADSATAKKIQDALARLPVVPSGNPTNAPATSPGTLTVGSKWQGNVNVKKDRDAVNYAAKATILESDASGFTIDANFLDREWIYKFKKNSAGILELVSAEAKAGAGITKGINKVYASKVEVVTETGKEMIRIRTVRKDGNTVIDSSYDLRSAE